MERSLEKINDSTDIGIINKIFQERFLSSRVFLKTPELNMPVESFIIQEGIIQITLSVFPGNIRKVIFYIRDNEELVFSHAKLLSGNDEQTLSYVPLDIHVMHINEKMTGDTLKTGNDRPAIQTAHISNIVSDFLIHDALISSRKRVDFIREQLVKKIKIGACVNEIIFLNEKADDKRMEYFKTKRKPYFVRNISKEINDEARLKIDPELKYFATSIYPRDLMFEQRKIVSEISVPLLYKSMLPFGYVKILSANELDDSDYNTIRKLGMSVSTIFTNDRTIIKGSDDRMTVSDFSMSGLGIFFKDKTLIKHFKDNSPVLFTLFLPGNRQSTMLCVVKNIIIIRNNVFKIDCEISDIDSIGDVNYSEFLDGIKK